MGIACKHSRTIYTYLCKFIHGCIMVICYFGAVIVSLLYVLQNVRMLQNIHWVNGVKM